MTSVIILAIIQALTEFIPVSSSGHLIAAQEIFDLESSLALDVALHFGTLLALLVYFTPKFIDILKNLRDNTELLAYLVITSIPAAVVGFIFADAFENDVRSLGIVIVMLATVGFVMLFSEDEKYFKEDKQIKDYEHMGGANALFIGIGQAFALIPGTSRSGITILTAKKAGLNNRLAAEYAFLAGVPIIAGAALKVFLDPETSKYLQENTTETIVGILIAFGVGLLTLRFLIQYVANNGLRVFGWYRLALAAVLFIIWINQ